MAHIEGKRLVFFVSVFNRNSLFAALVTQLIERWAPVRFSENRAVTTR